MKELFKTNDPTLISFATALLKGEDISCFTLDVHMSVLEGSIGIMPRRVMVANDDLFLARAILRDNDFELSEV
jgi:hypothetical protein